jgi:protein-disulfide isomerase-like protein with CxxC motif
MTAVEVIEYTDPGCVWSWAFEPRRAELRKRYGIAWRRVLGVQRDGVSWDDGQPLKLWRDVAGLTGASAPGELAWTYTSTRPAALAVKAAERQGDGVAELVLRRLREAFFLDGHPPDTPARIAAALERVDGVDVALLQRDAASTEVLAALAADWEQTRRVEPGLLSVAPDGPHPGIPVSDGDRLRYAFPTLLFSGPGGRHVVPGWRPLEAYLEAAAAVEPSAVAS